MTTLVIILVAWIAFSAGVVLFACMASARFSSEEDGSSNHRGRRERQDVSPAANFGQAPVQR